MGSSGYRYWLAGRVVVGCMMHNDNSTGIPLPLFFDDRGSHFVIPNPNIMMSDLRGLLANAHRTMAGQVATGSTN